MGSRARPGDFRSRAARRIASANSGFYQMLGRSYTTWDGVRCDFIGAIDYETKGAKDRMIGKTAVPSEMAF